MCICLSCFPISALQSITHHCVTLLFLTWWKFGQFSFKKEFVHYHKRVSCCGSLCEWLSWIKCVMEVEKEEEDLAELSEKLTNPYLLKSLKNTWLQSFWLMSTCRHKTLMLFIYFAMLLCCYFGTCPFYLYCAVTYFSDTWPYLRVSDDTNGYITIPKGTWRYLMVPD